MAVRGLADAFAPTPASRSIDVLEGVSGFVPRGAPRHRPRRQDDAALPRGLGAPRPAAPRHGRAGRLRPDRGRAAAQGSDHGPGLVRHRGPHQRPQRRPGHQPGQPRRAGARPRRLRPHHHRQGVHRLRREDRFGVAALSRLAGDRQAVRTPLRRAFRQQAAAGLPVPAADGVPATRLRRADANRRLAEADGDPRRDGVGRLPREVLRLQDDLADAGRPGRHAGDAARSGLQRLSAGARGPRTGLPRPLRAPAPASAAAGTRPSRPGCTSARSRTSGSTTSSAPACTTSSAASATWSQATPTSRNIADCRTTSSWKRCATAP